MVPDLFAYVCVHCGSGLTKLDPATHRVNCMECETWFMAPPAHGAELKALNVPPPAPKPFKPMAGVEVSQEFLRILGLQDQHVETLSIHLEAEKPIKVLATLYVEKGQIDEMTKVMKEHYLVPYDPDLVPFDPSDELK